MLSRDSFSGYSLFPKAVFVFLFIIQLLEENNRNLETRRLNINNHRKFLREEDKAMEFLLMKNAHRKDDALLRKENPNLRNIMVSSDESGEILIGSLMNLTSKHHLAVIISNFNLFFPGLGLLDIKYEL